MQIFRNVEDAGQHIRRSVVSIGNFDGVHRGHQQVISTVVKRARTLDASAVAVTFDPHPAHLLRPGAAPLLLITPLEQKLQLLAKTGLDAVLVLPFGDDLRRWTAEEFAARVLQEALGAQEVHEGETFRFGYDAAADIRDLAKLGRQMGFSVEALDPVILRGAPVSSSRIRTTLRAGHVSEGRALLGRPFAISSHPARGRGYGTRYAVPTVNLAPYRELLPGNGVYATTLRVGQGAAANVFCGVTNAGNRPTFGADSFAVETHLFDFEPLALTEETPLELTFLLRLRDERRFEGAEALRAQIALDVGRAQRYFRLSESLWRT